MTTSGQHRTRRLSGRAKSRYIQALLERAGATAQAATEADAEIVQVLVTAPAAERASVSRPSRRSLPRAVAASPMDGAPTQAASPGKALATAPEAVPALAFNPYAFSAMAVLLNEGRAALEARLAEATSRDHIVQLAEAQSVRLDPALIASSRKSSLAALRRAFIDAVEKRVAHRRAITG